MTSLVICKYDNTGRQIGMEELRVPVASSVTPPANAGSGDTRFFYDDNQNRVKMVTTTGNVYYFVYDPTASIPAVIYEQGPTKRYLNIREPDGSLISRETYDSNGIRTMSRTYHFDGLGSTIVLTDEGGAVTDRYSYSAWGNATHTSGTTSDNPYQYVGQLGYYTHYQEPTFGLLQLGVRYYDPTVGRFTERDRIDNKNWSRYAYAASSPLRMVDPRGLQPLPEDIIRNPMCVADEIWRSLFDGRAYDAWCEHDQSPGGAHIIAFTRCMRDCAINSVIPYDELVNYLKFPRYYKGPVKLCKWPRYCVRIRPSLRGTPGPLVWRCGVKPVLKKLLFYLNVLQTLKCAVDCIRKYPEAAESYLGIMVE